ncbi:hypothetical protein ACLOJK_036534 [Asimina triloba]
MNLGEISAGNVGLQNPTVVADRTLKVLDSGETSNDHGWMLPSEFGNLLWIMIFVTRICYCRDLGLMRMLPISCRLAKTLPTLCPIFCWRQSVFISYRCPSIVATDWEGPWRMPWFGSSANLPLPESAMPNLEEDEAIDRRCCHGYRFRELNATAGRWRRSVAAAGHAANLPACQIRRGHIPASSLLPVMSFWNGHSCHDLKMMEHRMVCSNGALK